MPIFRAAGLLVLKTMVGKGEAVGESDGEGEVEEMEEEDDEASRVSCEHVRDCLSSECPLSVGDGERGVGGSEEVKDMSEEMLEVELSEGVSLPRDGGEELDEEGREDSS